MNIPKPAKKIHVHRCHGDERVDEYYWLQQKETPEVIDHLNEENKYTEHILSDVAPLKQDLLNELKSRILEDDDSVPYRHGDFEYFHQYLKGKQYPVYKRKKPPSTADETLLDPNQIKSDYFSLGSYTVSPNHRFLAYAIDLDGSEKFSLYIKEIETGQIVAGPIENTYYGVAWDKDSKSVYYSVLNKNERPDRVYRHLLADSSSDQLIYQEDDQEMFVFIDSSRSGEFIFFSCGGMVTQSVFAIETSGLKPPFEIIPRKVGVEYSVDHRGDYFYILTNEDAENFKLLKMPVLGGPLEMVVEHNEANVLENISAFKDLLVVECRENGQEKIRIIESDFDHEIEFPEKLSTVALSNNFEYQSSSLRVYFSALTVPPTIYDYDYGKKNLVVRKVKAIPGGYDRTQYESYEKIILADDGAQIPVSFLSKKNSENKNYYLYGYGSYGSTVGLQFSSSRLCLLDRGVTFCIAHVRGGGKMGRRWYKDGKFLKKKNTFSDFCKVAEFLKDERQAEHIGIVGGSAGGMLVGASLNLRPDLFSAAVAHVPFVDVLTTMLNDQLPLTTMEYEEWGNPNDKEFYQYMKSYSPYDNVEQLNYPHLLVTAGLNDPRVTYWEPAKWVARLRDKSTSSNMCLLFTHMGAGHGGASGRYDQLQDVALEYSFLLKSFRWLP